ncbi:MAG: TadE/TadG family type IV pilus assembly protein [Cypionkella sp.]
MSMIRTIRRLWADRAGSMAVETAIVAPVLATMTLGAFEASVMLSRQQQLQSAANQAAEIVLAASNGSGVSSNDLKTIIVSSLGLQSNQLTIVPRYRCDDAATLLATAPGPSDCPSSKPVYQYVQLTLTETYTPTWTSYGIGSPLNYNIVRTVQVS